MKILLIGKGKFLVDTAQKRFHCHYGEIDLREIKRYGQRIRSSLGYEFIVVKPSIIDLLKKCKRGPQIVMPKDAATILAITGIENGWRCLDAGGGSGFLAIFLANIVKPGGKVFVYEKNKEYAKNVKENVMLCGLEKIIKVKNEDVKNFKERNLDLITLDMKGAEKIIKKTYKALKHGGWLCIYSPHIEQQKAVVRKIENLGEKHFAEVQTLENIQRFWQINDYTHPKPKQIIHTGFMTFARKI